MNRLQLFGSDLGALFNRLTHRDSPRAAEPAARALGGHVARFRDDYEGSPPKRIDLGAVMSGASVPSGTELVDHINALRAKQGRGPIPQDDADRFKCMSTAQRRMYAATLYELDKIVLDGDRTATRDYMFNVMQHAADIAGNDRQLFQELTHQVFSAAAGQGSDHAPNGSNHSDLDRELAGGGPSKTGQYLEGIYARSSWKPGDFNPLVVDSQDPATSDMTHHFGEFLASGYNGTKIPFRSPDDAVTANDDPGKNPGDVRNGYFAVMIGDALKNGKISPKEAVDLTRWAFAADSGGNAPPPWGHTAADVKRSDADWSPRGPFGWFGRDYHGYLNTDHYNIDDWKRAYRQARPAMSEGEAGVASVS